jgi:hypothetical protein
MTTTELDTLTDYLAKTNSSMFPVAEKLIYYNIAYGILNGLIIDEQEDSFEAEYTKTTIAGQREYQENARIHHVNWLKVNYGNGFIPAQYRSPSSLISEYGNELETELSQWDSSSPIYWYTGSSYVITPAPSATQAGANRLWLSAELLPADLTAGTSPSLPANYHYLLAEYAAHKYHQNNGEDTQGVLRKKNFDEGTALMLNTMFPRARQQEMMAHIPFDTGENY